MPRGLQPGGGTAAGDRCGGEVARPGTGVRWTQSQLPSCRLEFHFVDTQHVRAPNRAEPVHMTPRWAHVQPAGSQTPSGGHCLRPVAPSPGWVHAGAARGGSMLSSRARRHLSQLSRFASHSGDGSAVPGPSPPPLRPGWYREDVGKWRPQPGTYTPDPQMCDTAAPAPTKCRCSPSPGSRSGPAPGSGIFPASPPSSLSSSLSPSLLPTHSPAPAERLPPAASPPVCGLVAPSIPGP